MESVNEVINLRTSRDTVALHYRIPPLIWFALLVVAVLSMVSIGFQFGMSGHKHRLIIGVLAVAFSTVILLIAGLDRASWSSLRTSQQPMLKLQQRLSAAGP